MPEIKKDELAALQSEAQKADDGAKTAPPGERRDQAQEAEKRAEKAPDSETVTISKSDLDRLIAEASKAGQTPAEDEPEPLPPTHVAILANGERFEYSGAHPTHVRDADGFEAQVIAVHPLPVQVPQDA